MRAWVIVVALLLPAALAAQETRADYLRQFDSNGDGKVSISEYVDYMSQGFQRMDANGDGVIEANEMPGGRGHQITLQERQADLRRQFQRMDRDHDGYLNARELTAPPG